MYTFGAGVTDNISITGLVAPFTTNRVSLITCWIRPTTLTATRCLWASGATWRLAIDTTTTSLRFMSDMATDGVFTFPAGLAVNTNTFVALLCNLGTSPTMAVKAWTATESTGPVERAVTVATSPVGAVTSSGSTMTIGNTSGGSLSFQGDIGGVTAHTDLTNANTNMICSIAADGSTSQAEADQVLAAYVDSLWRGDVLRFAGWGRFQSRGNAFALQYTASLDNSGGVWTIRPDSRSRGTATGATLSANRTPHWFDDQSTPQTNRRLGRAGYNVMV